MTPNATLTEALAKTVQEVPGVAFLKPGVAHRLRSALPGVRPGTASPAGLRITRPGGNEPWKIEVQIVTRADARVLDVTRATRTAVDTCLTALVPAEAVQVTITVTGIV